MLVSMIGNVTKVYTQARRSSSVVATSRITVIGVAVDASLVQMRLVAISDLRPVVSAYVPCSKKKRKRRVGGMAIATGTIAKAMKRSNLMFMVFVFGQVFESGMRRMG